MIDPPGIYLNENVAIRVSQLLRARGVRSFHTLEVDNGGISDEAQLEYAAAQGHILAMHNRSHFRALHQAWIQQGRRHAGILVMSFSASERISERIALFLEQVYPQLQAPFCTSPPRLEEL